MRKRSIKLLLWVPFVWCFSFCSSAKQTLEFSTFAKAGTSVVTRTIMTEAYRRIGYDIAIVEYPAARSIKFANTGKYDGELARLSIVQKKLDNLVMVPTPIFGLKQIVVTKNKVFVPDGWKSLQPYTAASLIGYKYTESKLIEHDIKHGLVTRFEQILKTVKAGRFDVGILANLDGLQAMQESGIYLKILEPEIDSFFIYHFIHKKNKHLVPLVNEQLQQLREEGFIDKVEQDAIKRLSKRE